MISLRHFQKFVYCKYLFRLRFLYQSQKWALKTRLTTPKVLLKKLMILKYENIFKIIGYLYDLIPELASGWDFFGIGILYFELDRKIPKPWGSGSGFENPEKISIEKSRKSRYPEAVAPKSLKTHKIQEAKIFLGFHGFLVIGIFFVIF